MLAKLTTGVILPIFYDRLFCTKMLCLFLYLSVLNLSKRGNRQIAEKHKPKNGRHDKICKVIEKNDPLANFKKSQIFRVARLIKNSK
jgi:hypothetical protein